MRERYDGAVILSYLTLIPMPAERKHKWTWTSNILGYKSWSFVIMKVKKTDEILGGYNLSTWDANSIEDIWKVTEKLQNTKFNS
ncbi:hypothetical protein Glove_352g43 [Diversispora epigaea]|uniref:Uncharacterized protein n=1 Tax=Diversispora epigaea TaxID=1348612 RepID=A0A397HCN9_9GLOM|nr:hypothetical protein Glove_352g43 [Diversispora epigaea]